MNKVTSVAVVTSIHPDFDARIWKHVRSLADNGIMVEFICPWKPAVDMCYPNIRFHVFPRVERRVSRPILIPARVLRALISVIREVQIVHFHDIDLLPWMAAVSLFKPVVYDVHENYAEEMMTRAWIPALFRSPLKFVVEAMHRIFPAVIKNVILVVPHQLNEFHSNKLNVLFLYNYASVKLLDGYQDDYAARANRVVFTGGHYSDNGSDLLVEIATRMKNHGIAAEIIATDRFASSEHKDKYLEIIQNKGLDNIKIINSVSSSELMKLLNHATIAIAPNLRVRKQELAIPTKLFEYMAAALPIVSSDLPYQKDLFSRHAIGLLAQPECPDSFVRAIERLIDDRGMAEELGRTGQSVFKEMYTWESQIPRLIDFYCKILK